MYLLSHCCLWGLPSGQSIYSVKNLKSDVDIYLDLKKDITFFQVNGGITDTVGVADSTWVKTFSVDNLYDALKSTAKMTLDSLSGTPTITVTQEGKDFWDDAPWTVILTEDWAGTTGDTTLLFNGSTAKHYRFYRYKVAMIQLLWDRRGLHDCNTSFTNNKWGLCPPFKLLP